MAVNWALGLPQSTPNNGVNGMMQGMKMGGEIMSRQAMAALVQNPNDPQALAALAKVDPQSAMEFRQQNIANSKALLAQHQDSIIKGAEILRQFNPQDQASYTAALAAAQQAGVDISQVPQQFNPQYVQGVIHIADALKPGAQDPSPIREYQQAVSQGLLPKETSYTQFLQLKNPGMNSPVNVPYGATVSAGSGGGQMPHVTDQQSYDAIPPGTQYTTPDGHVRVKGGQSGAAPAGNFSGSSYSR